MEHPSLQNVSRETIDRLRSFEQLAQKWTKKINLVSAKDAPLIWDRHIVDSVQIYDLAPAVGDWLDIGSGGGFPGLVAAIIAKDLAPERQFTLVDSDQRKCAFLRTVSRELGLKVKVFAERVEEMEPMNVDVLSARAMDDLTGLLFHMKRHVSPSGIALFPKGERWEDEHRDAHKKWSYDIEVVKSVTNPQATILKIKELKHV